MSKIDDLKVKYPGAIAWSFGDTPEMADELADLVVKGIKTAACGSLSSFIQEEESPLLVVTASFLTARMNRYASSE